MSGLRDFAIVVVCFCIVVGWNLSGCSNQASKSPQRVTAYSAGQPIAVYRNVVTVLKVNNDYLVKLPDNAEYITLSNCQVIVESELDVKE